MRNKIVAANWKMNLTYAEAMSVADTLTFSADDFGDIGIIIAAPFVYLHDLVGRIQSRPNFSIAAQNCSEKDRGAFTGEISASMLTSIGVEHVLVGHSERRTLYGETDNVVAAKIQKVLDNRMIPIFCCGENQVERKGGEHLKRVEEQLERGLFNVDVRSIHECIVAYEPVWAIGTGVHATNHEVAEMHAFIRDRVARKYGPETAENLTLLYGGSVTSQNAKELFRCPDVDGGLVGSASLKANEFIKIISAMNEIIPIKQ